MRKLFIILLLALTLACASTPSVQQSAALAAQSTNQSRGNPSVKVWVNTNSSVYHCPGTRWYGATKEGYYTTQKKAQEAGNRPAYGRYCE
jgi:hypothetical protein